MRAPSTQRRELRSHVPDRQSVDLPATPLGLLIVFRVGILWKRKTAAEDILLLDRVEMQRACAVDRHRIARGRSSRRCVPCKSAQACRSDYQDQTDTSGVDWRQATGALSRDR